MREAKKQIILDEGTPVEVLDANGTVLETTNALIGRATKQSYAELALESHRQGQFIPEVSVANGRIIHALVTDAYYLVLASLDEVVGGDKIATITRLVECNSSLTVKRVVEVADDNGNIKKNMVTVVDGLKVYIMSGKATLEQRKPGLHQDVEYTIYSPYFDIQILDNVMLTMNGKTIPFKVVNVDYTTFQGIAVIDVSSETRR